MARQHGWKKYKLFSNVYSLNSLLSFHFHSDFESRNRKLLYSLAYTLSPSCARSTHCRRTVYTVELKCMLKWMYWSIQCLHVYTLRFSLLLLLFLLFLANGKFDIESEFRWREKKKTNIQRKDGRCVWMCLSVVMWCDVLCVVEWNAIYTIAEQNRYGTIISTIRLRLRMFAICFKPEPTWMDDKIEIQIQRNKRCEWKKTPNLDDERINPSITYACAFDEH